MPTFSQLKLPATLLVLIALLVLPTAAGATLTYSKGFQKPRVYYAEDNGKGATRSASAATPTSRRTAKT